MIYLQVNQTEVVLLTLFVLWKLCDNLLLTRGQCFQCIAHYKIVNKFPKLFLQKTREREGIL